MLESNRQTLLVFLVSIRSIIIFVDGVEVFWLDIDKPTGIKMESPGDRSLFSRLEFQWPHFFLCKQSWIQGKLCLLYASNVGSLGLQPGRGSCLNLFIYFVFI